MRSTLAGIEGKASRDQDAPSICLVSRMIQTAYAAGIMVMTMEAQFGELDYRSRRSAGLGEKDVILRVEDEKKDEDGGG